VISTLPGIPELPLTWPGEERRRLEKTREERRRTEKNGQERRRTEKTGEDRRRTEKNGKDWRRPEKNGEERRRTEKNGKDWRRPEKTGEERRRGCVGPTGLCTRPRVEQRSADWNSERAGAVSSSIAAPQTPMEDVVAQGLASSSAPRTGIVRELALCRAPSQLHRHPWRTRLHKASRRAALRGLE